MNYFIGVDVGGTNVAVGVVDENNKIVVNVGSLEHPMVEEHYIEWISLQTNLGNQRKVLKPEEKPEASFLILEGEKPEAVYAYCNLHGLWKAEV